MSSAERNKNQSIEKNLISTCSRQLFQKGIQMIAEALGNNERSGDRTEYLISALCRKYTVMDFEFLKREAILQKLSEIEEHKVDDKIKGQAKHALCSIISQIITSFSQCDGETVDDDMLNEVKRILFANLKHYNDNASSRMERSISDSAQLLRTQTITRTSSRTGKQIIDLNQDYQCKACAYLNPKGQLCALCNSDQENKIERYENIEVTQWQVILNLELLLTIFRMRNKTLEQEDVCQILRLGKGGKASSPMNQLFALKLLQNMITFTNFDSDLLEAAATKLLNQQTDQAILACNDSKFI